MRRTHGCGTLRAQDAGEQVALAGWVHHRRDHGKVIFLDLRDASGTVQVVVHADEAPDAYAAANTVQREFCVRLDGAVAARSSHAVNDKLPTGAIEVKAATLEVLSASETPPFLIEDGIEADEVTRLHYRYLDLRRPEMQRTIRLRTKMVTEIRRFLDERDFVEIETPILFKSTPEGARDYLVPARVQPGSFYALPQSPQILKQLLMVAGFERYYQIARCFRDEDLRADRQPEFTQLDLEMSFAEPDDVMGLMEELYAHVWRACVGAEIETPFPRIPYAEAVARFGSDHVDLRYGMELTDVAPVFAETTLGIFQKVMASGGIMRAIAVTGGADLHHNDLKRYERQAMERGAKGLAWIALQHDGEVDSPLAKHLSERELAGLREALGAGPGDLVLLVADEPSVVNPVLGALRRQIAHERGLARPDDWRFCWVVDYPYFEREGQEWIPIHHPFTRMENPETFGRDLAKDRALAYDVVLNGSEVGGGSIRIHQPEVQAKVFEALGIDERTANERFGFLLEAFRYGPPPHGGIALGLDRMAMLLAGTDNIRDVIAFPKTQSAADLLSGAPSPVDPAQLRELGIRVVE
ncbi:MAG TPA: aspartate--tRNA ligase [Actinomycetota bacterium]